VLKSVAGADNVTEITGFGSVMKLLLALRFVVSAESIRG
jgi:hypothetical protein